MSGVRQAVYVILCGYRHEGYIRPGKLGAPDTVWYDETLAKKEAEKLMEKDDAFDFVNVVELWPAPGQE